jgi:hypothetical protein
MAMTEPFSTVTLPPLQKVESAITHAHISLSLVLVVLLMFGSLIGVYIHSSNQFERELGAANQQFQTYQKDQETQRKTLQDDLNQRLGDIKAEQQLQETMIARDKKAAGTVKQVTNPDNTIQQVAKDSQAYLGVLPTFTADNLLAYPPHDVQSFIQFKVERDQFSDDLKTVAEQLVHEKSQTASLQKDLDGEKTLNATANDTIKKYQTVAQKSKFKRFLSSTWSYGKDAAIIALGAKILLAK